MSQRLVEYIKYVQVVIRALSLPYSSSGAQQSSLSKASASSFTGMPTVVISREEDDEKDGFVAPLQWVSLSTWYP